MKSCSLPEEVVLGEDFECSTDTSRERKSLVFDIISLCLESSRAVSPSVSLGTRQGLLGLLRKPLKLPDKVCKKRSYALGLPRSVSRNDLLRNDLKSHVRNRGALGFEPNCSTTPECHNTTTNISTTNDHHCAYGVLLSIHLTRSIE